MSTREPHQLFAVLVLHCLYESIPFSDFPAVSELKLFDLLRVATSQIGNTGWVVFPEIGRSESDHDRGNALTDEHHEESEQRAGDHVNLSCRSERGKDKRRHKDNPVSFH